MTNSHIKAISLFISLNRQQLREEIRRLGLTDNLKSVGNFNSSNDILLSVLIDDINAAYYQDDNDADVYLGEMTEEDIYDAECLEQRNHEYLEKSTYPVILEKSTLPDVLNRVGNQGNLAKVGSQVPRGTGFSRLSSLPKKYKSIHNLATRSK